MSYMKDVKDPPSSARTMSIVFLHMPIEAPIQHRQLLFHPRHTDRLPPLKQSLPTTRFKPENLLFPDERPTHPTQATPPDVWEQFKVAPDSSNLRERILSAARDIAHETSPSARATPAISQQSRLSQGIAAAFKPRGTSIEELRASDGSPITKVSGPAGTYCVMREANNGAGDPFRYGLRDKVVSCSR